MSILSALRQEAEHVAVTLQARIGELDREIRQKAAERAQLVDEKNHAALAAQRFEKYPVMHGSNILCPYCWVGRGQLSALASFDDAGQEALRCDSCLTELVTDEVQGKSS
jgi:predicted DsbA family dithiol-disulfide isomerase